MPAYKWNSVKIDKARKMVRQGATLQEIAQAIGYKSGSTVRRFLQSHGLLTPVRNRPK